jgi:hypothetical protein
MIQRSLSLERALERETVRFAGSLACFVFYAGDMPTDCNGVALGERVAKREASEFAVRHLLRGMQPLLLGDATYWRLYDANGNVVMQGDGA